MRKTIYKVKNRMSPLLKTKLSILNIIEDSELTNAQVVFLLEDIKQKILLKSILSNNEVFKNELKFTEVVDE